MSGFSIIEGAYFQDILNQPQALCDTLQGLDVSRALSELATRLQNKEFERIVLTGMGSSFHALHPLHLQLIECGHTSIMVETSELVHYHTRLFNRKTLIVAVSQSGRSAEIVRLLEMNQGNSALIAVTNTVESPLAQNATAVALTRAGSEFSVSCKTYVAALVALQWIADVLCGGDLGATRADIEHSVPAVREYLSHWQSHVGVLTEALKEISHLFLVGRGASLAAVGTGALIVKESDHFHAEGMSSAAFRHGPFEMLNGDSFVLVFEGDHKTAHLNQRLLTDIQSQGGRSQLAGQDATLAPLCLPRVPPNVRPIVEILPVEMITLALAAQVGREAGKFELASKVTTTE